MLIEQFNLLSDEEKEDAIWKHGIFLSNFDEGSMILDVYALFKFYVGFSYELNKTQKAVITSHHHANELPLLININRLN